MERIKVLNEFYSLYNEDDRLKTRHGKIEFLTTIRYIEKYLRTGMKVLEVGAGTGIYSHYIAQQGYHVDAIELMDCNISVFKKNTKDNESISIMQGDAVNLENIQNEVYDITLLLGPMYHLFNDNDKISALSEAIRVTKPNGVIFVAYCLNEAQIIKMGFIHKKFKESAFREIVNPVTFKATYEEKDIFQLYRKEEIDDLMSHFSVERLHYVGTDMATSYIKECVDSMDDDLFEVYLKYHFSICERTDCVGVSHHSLDVFRKNS